MSDKLGPLEYGENQEEVFLGHSVARNESISSETAKLIDQEVREIVDGGHEKAKQILTDNIDDLHTLAKALLEYETLSGDEIKDLLAGKEIQRNDPADDAPASTPPTGSVPSSGAPSSGSGSDGISGDPLPEA